jgi:hypothetical protein
VASSTRRPIRKELPINAVSNPSPEDTAAVASGCRPIFVLGADRSGTSLISEIIYRWGANAGDITSLGSANEGNPRGYWEYEPMEELLDKLFAAAGVSPWHPEFPGRVRALTRDPALRAEVLRLVAGMEEGPAWFWKEPNLCLCLPFFVDIVPAPLFVVAIRNPYESALSYEKFILPSTLYGTIRLRSLYLLRWQQLVVSILEHAVNHPGVIYVPYVELVNDPADQCDRLCAFLDRECGVDGDRTQRVQRMIQTVEPALRRNRGDRLFDTADEATPTQRALFRHLLQRVGDPALPFSAADYPLPPGGKEYLENADLMLSMLRKL